MTRGAAAIVVAGGTGSRFGLAGGKQLAPLDGRPVVSWTLEAVAASRGIDLVVLVCHPEAVPAFVELCEAADLSGTPVAVAPGGITRRDSVAAGLELVPDEFDTVLVHDGARPLADVALVDAALRFFGDSAVEGIVVGHRSVDTIKVVSGNRVVETPDRSTLWVIQTPQVFSVATLREAHRAAARDGFDGTDDASLVERVGGTVLVLEGPRDNIKITTPEDGAVAEALLARRREGRM